MTDGPIDGEGFRTDIEKTLAPTLKPGDVVIMDNLGSHKGEAVRQAIRSSEAKLFFPKHSPDLNPIEQVFAKLKHLLRKAALRTLETSMRSLHDTTRNERALPRFYDRIVWPGTAPSERHNAVRSREI
jgi:transposase